MNLSTVFHPQTNGKAERTIYTFEDMLRSCVNYFKENLDDHVSLIEFTYNNSYHPSIQMDPMKPYVDPFVDLLLGGSKFVTGLIGLDLVHQSMGKLKVIQERLKMAQSRQNSYIDIKRTMLDLEVDDWVFLKFSLMKGVMRFGKKGKLSFRYIGPYRI